MTMPGIEENRKLIERFPFLLPRDDVTGEVMEDYDYSYTELDELPPGWRLVFGEQMCEELSAALKRAGLLDEYQIIQIKEKFGQLRWYDNNYTPEVQEIILKYMRVSERTCIVCGKPATYITKGWTCPYCDECVPKEQGIPVDAVPIDEFYR